MATLQRLVTSCARKILASDQGSHRALPPAQARSERQDRAPSDLD